MAGVTKCIGTDCPLRQRCYRYTATPSEHGQSWADFTGLWHCDNERLEVECPECIPALERQRNALDDGQ
jgi:hypothetical protein